MKKFIVSIIAILLFMAQDCMSQDTEFSIKAGLNVNDLGGAKVGMYNTVGFHAGVALEFIANSNFSLQPELLFSQQGGSPIQNREVKLNYNYLNLPILIKWYVLDDMDVHIGPQFGLLISANESTDFGDLNVTDQLNAVDYGIIGGMRYKFHQRWATSLRYYLGIRNTNQQKVIFENRETNRVFQASLVYFL